MESSRAAALFIGGTRGLATRVLHRVVAYQDWSRRVAKLRWALFTAPRGLGIRGFSEEVWDEQYREGTWSCLASPEAIGHYAIVAAYLRRLFVAPSVLDVGCGDGQLLKLLGSGFSRPYLGVDLSSEAIRRIRALGIAGADFEVANFEYWTPPRRFDAICFLESLYFARDPAETLQRYSRMLSPNGVFLVSMFRFRNTWLIWRRLEAHFSVLFSMKVQNRLNKTWTVKVLQPAGGGGVCGEAAVEWQPNPAMAAQDE